MRSGYCGRMTPAIGVGGIFFQNIIQNGIPSDDVTFTRASNAVFFNQNNLLETAANDVLRVGKLSNDFDFRGAVIESSGTNLQDFSKDFDSAWSKAGSMTATEGETDPFGGATATLIQRGDTAASYIQRVVSKDASAIQYTSSVFVHKSEGTCRYFSHRVQGSFPARVDIIYDKQTDSIVSATQVSTFTLDDYGLEDYGDYARLWVVFTTDTNSTVTQLLSCSDDQITIDGTDSSSDATGVLFGTQLEQNSYVTSYNPTAGSATTRSADVTSIDLTVQNWFNADEGTIFGQFKRSSGTQGRTWVFSINNNASSARIDVEMPSGAGTLVRAVGVDTSEIVSLTETISANDTVKFAFGYKLNDYGFCANGGAVKTELSAVVPSNLVNFDIGMDSASNNQLEGVIKTLGYYPKRLPNNLLQSITNTIF
jgi:hypothetical protein